MDFCIRGHTYRLTVPQNRQIELTKTFWKYLFYIYHVNWNTMHTNTHTIDKKKKKHAFKNFFVCPNLYTLYLHLWALYVRMFIEDRISMAKHTKITSSFGWAQTWISMLSTSVWSILFSKSVRMCVLSPNIKWCPICLNRKCEYVCAQSIEKWTYLHNNQLFANNLHEEPHFPAHWPFDKEWRFFLPVSIFVWISQNWSGRPSVFCSKCWKTNLWSKKINKQIRWEVEKKWTPGKAGS